MQLASGFTQRGPSQKLTVAHLTKDILLPHCREPEGSLPCSKELAIIARPEPDEFSPHQHTTLI
jgi:hypothetical protein